MNQNPTFIIQISIDPKDMQKGYILSLDLTSKLVDSTPTEAHSDTKATINLQQD